MSYDACAIVEDDDETLMGDDVECAGRVGAHDIHDGAGRDPPEVGQDARDRHKGQVKRPARNAFGR